MEARPEMRLRSGRLLTDVPSPFPVSTSNTIQGQPSNNNTLEVQSNDAEKTFTDNDKNTVLLLSRTVSSVMEDLSLTNSTLVETMRLLRANQEKVEQLTIEMKRVKLQSRQNHRPSSPSPRVCLYKPVSKFRHQNSDSYIASRVQKHDVGVQTDSDSSNDQDAKKQASKQKHQPKKKSVHPKQQYR